MKIGINLLRFDPDINIGGNYTFAYKIVEGLLNNSEHEYYLFITAKNKKMFQFENVNAKYVLAEHVDNIFKKLFYENKFIMKNIKDNKLDLFYSPCFLLPLRKLAIPSIATIHDINFKHFSQGKLKDLYKNIIYPNTLRNASNITTVSEFTKNDIDYHYKGFHDKITVVYNGCDFDPEVNESLFLEFKNKYNINFKYFLALNHHKHKNAKLAIEAFSLFKERSDENYKLIIVGTKKEYKDEIKLLIESKNLNDDVILIDYLEQKFMASIYYGASIFLFPSLFEGFGIPVLEAMSMGCPVIASKCASIPEVVLDSGILLDINNPTEWADSMMELMSNEYEYGRYQESGRLRVKDFSWDNSAKEFIRLFQRYV